VQVCTPNSFRWRTWYDPVDAVLLPEIPHAGEGAGALLVGPDRYLCRTAPAQVDVETAPATGFGAAGPGLVPGRPCLESDAGFELQKSILNLTMRPGLCARKLTTSRRFAHTSVGSVKSENNHIAIGARSP
jgi:hypothetical protein